MRLWPTFLVCVPFLAGCGSDGSSRREVVVPTGFTVRAVDRPQLSLALPKRWRSFDRRSPAASPGLDAALSAEVALLKRPDSPIKLIGVGPARPGGFVPNVNVIETRVPDALTFDQLVKREAMEVKAGTQARGMRQSTTLLPAGRALRLTYRTPAGAAIHQYFVLHDDFLYIVTYTAAPAAAAQYAKIFGLSAHTFQVE